MSKKEKTHYLIVLDQSGSMEDIKDTVISLFNEQLQSLQKQAQDRNIEVTLSVFNDDTSIINLQTDINKVKELNEENYNPNYMTALYDAIMISYNAIKASIRKKDRFIALVLTDGMENASKEYNYKDVQKLIKKIEKRGGKFNFLCSEMDVRDYSERLEIDIDCSLAFDSADFGKTLSNRLMNVNHMILDIEPGIGEEENTKANN